MLAIFVAAALSAATNQNFDAAQAYGRRPYLSGVSLAPSGDQFAAFVNDRNYSGLGIYQLDGDGGFSFFLKDEGDFRVRRFAWKAEDRLLVSFGRFEIRSSSRRIMIGEARHLLSVNPVTAEKLPLFEPGTRNKQVVVQDEIISLLPDDPRHVLVQYRPSIGGGLGVYKVAIDQTGGHIQVERARKDTDVWFTDPTGAIRARGRYGASGRFVAHLRETDGSWANFTAPLNNLDTTFRILGFPDDPNTVYIASDHETDTESLYAYQIDERSFGPSLFNDPTSDIVDIVVRPFDGRAIGVTVADENIRTEWLRDTKYAAFAEALRKGLGAKRVELLGVNETGSVGVYVSHKDREPPRVVVFDFDKRHFTELPSQYPELDGRFIGKVHSQTYKARDGLEIQAYVTLPAYVELEDANGLPFIVLPHGGPKARDYGEFDWMAQFFAELGFGVFQMNFRGSAGYGTNFRNAGDRQWGQAMQDDIEDGVKWLIGTGMADEEKISVIGASYGGYAALMGAVKTPDLYRCAVSINGVTDLPRLLSWARGQPGGKRRSAYIGSLWSDREMLRENSPLRHADKITIPVLLATSEYDDIVPPEQHELMLKALQKAGKPVDAISLRRGSHYLDVGNNREQLLRGTAQFLRTCR
ncbi:S9 family peptidase [Parvularcula sp. ZS-1/3]|uniref:S9 family peptidase n=1 Tax=Parvularcula mediterranea TaxID=2732508 RepID=A0A7Y3RLP1_9PROT|nr:prolyl oligopeptidase family serine peptidase [Parvularcula mediterranea]NNU15885.1 S9 family peptidase [Parvularcula mediterranea]